MDKKKKTKKKYVPSLWGVKEEEIKQVEPVEQKIVIDEPELNTSIPTSIRTTILRSESTEPRWYKIMDISKSSLEQDTNFVMSFEVMRYVEEPLLTASPYNTYKAQCVLNIRVASTITGILKMSSRTSPKYGDGVLRATINDDGTGSVWVLFDQSFMMWQLNLFSAVTLGTVTRDADVTLYKQQTQYQTTLPTGTFNLTPTLTGLLTSENGTVNITDDGTNYDLSAEGGGSGGSLRAAACYNSSTEARYYKLFEMPIGAQYESKYLSFEMVRGAVEPNASTSNTYKAIFVVNVESLTTTTTDASIKAIPTDYSYDLPGKVVAVTNPIDMTFAIYMLCDVQYMSWRMNLLSITNVEAIDETDFTMYAQQVNYQITLPTGVRTPVELVNEPSATGSGILTGSYSQTSDTTITWYKVAEIAAVPLNENRVISFEIVRAALDPRNATSAFGTYKALCVGNFRITTTGDRYGELKTVATSSQNYAIGQRCKALITTNNTIELWLRSDGSYETMCVNIISYRDLLTASDKISEITVYNTTTGQTTEPTGVAQATMRITNLLSGDANIRATYDGTGISLSYTGTQGLKSASAYQDSSTTPTWYKLASTIALPAVGNRIISFELLHCYYDPRSSTGIHNTYKSVMVGNFRSQGGSILGDIKAISTSPDFQVNDQIIAVVNSDLTIDLWARIDSSYSAWHMNILSFRSLGGDDFISEVTTYNATTGQTTTPTGIATTSPYRMDYMSSADGTVQFTYNTNGIDLSVVQGEGGEGALPWASCYDNTLSGTRYFKLAETIVYPTTGNFNTRTLSFEVSSLFTGAAYANGGHFKANVVVALAYGTSTVLEASMTVSGTTSIAELIKIVYNNNILAIYVGCPDDVSAIRMNVFSYTDGEGGDTISELTLYKKTTSGSLSAPTGTIVITPEIS